MRTPGWDLAGWGLALYLGAWLLSVWIPGARPLALAGLALHLVGLYLLTQALRKPRIFTDPLIGHAILWVGFALVPSTIAIGTRPRLEPIAFSAGPIPAGFLALWLFGVAAAMFIRRGFRSLAEASGEPRFSLAGDLILWGAVAGIVLFGYLAWIAGEGVALFAFLKAPGSP